MHRRLVLYRPEANAWQMAWCLNVLVWKMPADGAAWLKGPGVMELNHATDLDLRWDVDLDQFVPGTLPVGLFAAGPTPPAIEPEADKPRDEVASDHVTQAERQALEEH